MYPVRNSLVSTATDFVPEHREAFDLDKVLPLELIREHTKTDDIPSVSDALLGVYRAAAVQAAEEYTGLLIGGQRVRVDLVPEPGYIPGVRRPPFFLFTASARFATHVAYYYGLTARPEMVQVQPGQRRVRLPVIYDSFGMGCCNPCGTIPQGRLQYTAGYGCEADIPPAFALGALKYIAHVIGNPGDNVIAANVSGQAQSNIGVDIASNPALASGAIEIWRVMLPDAI